MNAADKYYLKAKANYPWELEEAIEALEYGLAHDEEHPGLLTLKGDIYYRQLKQFEAARECYELALLSDHCYVDAYYSYIQFAMQMNDYTRAEKLVANALRVQGINKARVLYYNALLLEKQYKYPVAIDNLKQAMQCALDQDAYEFMEEQMERVESKEQKVKESRNKINIILK